MLILSRHTGESIIIGSGKDKIIIKLLSTQGRQSKLGIDAPSRVTIHREEIYKIVRAELEAKEADDNE